MFISIITDPGIGGTFVEWTIHYLSGNDEYYSVKKNKRLPVPSNPLTSKNAHNFSSSCSSLINVLIDFIEKIKKDNSPLQTLYFHHLYKEINDESIVHLPTVSAIKSACSLSDKIVTITLNKKDILYRCGKNKRNIGRHLTDKHQFYKTETDQFNHFLETYFSKENYNLWDENNIWDYREYFALNIDPYHYTQYMEPYIKKIENKFCIDAFELFENFDVEKLFDYLQLEINKNRYVNWLEVYKKWQTIHEKKVAFSKSFEIIIKKILHNHPMDLLQFDLDIVQEAAIQRSLIYDYNLNLSGWKLDKFVSCQQLHQLLEPNIHFLKEKVDNF
jgi:hypothetical protein